MCTLQVLALFCMKWHHGRHLETVTNRKSDRLRQSMNVYLRNNPVKFYLNDRALCFFEKDCRNKNNNKMWVVLWDQLLIQIPLVGMLSVTDRFGGSYLYKLVTASLYKTRHQLSSKIIRKCRLESAGLPTVRKFMDSPINQTKFRHIRKLPHYMFWCNSTSIWTSM